MRCSHCGHESPVGLKFCGMCGNRLVLDSPASGAPADSPQDELASARSPLRPSARPPQQESSQNAAEEFLRRRPESAPPPPLEPREPLPPPTSYIENGNQHRGEIHGPSFLGLNDTGDGSGDYLLDDEGSGSHAARLFVLLLLLVAVGLIAWKWEPIKTYVWTQASMHAQQAQPATATSQTDASSTADSNKPQAAAGSEPMPQDDKQDASSTTPSASSPKPETTVENSSTSTPSKPPEGNSADSSKKASSEDQAEKPAETKTPADESADSADASAYVPAKNAKQAKQAKNASADSESDADAADADTADEPVAPARAAKPAPAKPKPADGSDLLAKAESYLYGRGVPQNCRQALVYFKAAADKQNPSALSHVGAMYATGECGVRIDRVQAYKWFSKAYELQPSNQYLERNLTMLWRQMSDQERQSITRPSTRGE